MGIKRGNMKFPFFKSLLVAGALLLAWNCSDNTTMSPTNDLLALSEEARMLSTPDGYLYITEDGRVINGQGVEVAQVGEDGTFTYGDNEYQFNPDELEKVELAKTDDGKILVITEDNQVKDTEGNVIGQKNDDGTVTNENGDVIVDLNGGDNNDSGENGGENGEGGNENGNGNGNHTGYSSASNGSNNGNSNGNSNGNQTGNSSASNGNNNGNQTGNSSNSNGNNNQAQTSTASTNCGSGECYDSISGKCVKPHAQGLRGANDENYSYDESCKFLCWYDPAGKNCADIKPASNPTPSSTSHQQTPSSSSKQQQTPSSSSKANTSGDEAKYIDAGKGGTHGFASRYWDCCMPHCAQPDHGGTARTCDAKGKTKIGNNTTSVCAGGQGAACTSQTPIVVSDKLAYAFAATPGNDNTCGKCFALTFTGEGFYETKKNHQQLKGKTLVVMASNIGYDVSNGQFDIMIPGGGVGMYNGCSAMGWGNQGKQYGGLLSDCEEEIGYSGDDNTIYTRRKQCLTNKCNQVFANDSEAKDGCLFLATWMEAAGNPKHEYKQVDCPAALRAAY